MQEFSPGAIRRDPPHLTPNYFPIPNPDASFYPASASRNLNFVGINAEATNTGIFDLFALSEVALLAATVFGRDKKRRRRGRLSRTAQAINEVVTLPYKARSISLL